MQRSSRKDVYVTQRELLWVGGLFEARPMVASMRHDSEIQLEAAVLAIQILSTAKFDHKPEWHRDMP